MVNRSPSLSEQASRLADGDVAPVELLESTLDRIEASQERLNAFRVVRADAARAEALAAERRIGAGERLPLLGVPVAIKDDMDIAGETTAFGCGGKFKPKLLDGAVAGRLKAAGAVIVGKTNSPELGLWPFTEGSAFGVTRNPWSTDHSPGGSSGGSAAAVAAGLVSAAVGSDGAGSIRIPAAWTHLVGVKPQRGRISTWPDAEAFNGLTVNGPLARSVSDAALLLDVLSGALPGDRHHPPPPLEPFTISAAQEPPPMRLGVALNVPFSGASATLDPRIRSNVVRLADRLADLGHAVDFVSLPYGRWAGASFMPRSMAGVADWVDRVPDRSVLDSRVRGSARLGDVLRPLLVPARIAESIGRQLMGRVFRRFDAVLAPTTAQQPLKVGASAGLTGWETDKVIVAACPYAWPWNVLGWPAVNVPAGFTDGGLPVGAQLLGPGNSEARLLSLAGQLEKAERWTERWPG